jgi:hypothetical protein
MANISPPFKYALIMKFFRVVLVATFATVIAAGCRQKNTLTRGTQNMVLADTSLYGPEVQIYILDGCACNEHEENLERVEEQAFPDTSDIENEH